MLKTFAILFNCAFAVSTLVAQDTSNNYEIATDRPSVSFSAATTPKNTLIVESGYLQFNQKNNFSKTIILNPNLSLRYGINQRLEIRLGEEFLVSRTSFKTTDSLQKNAIFLPIFLGIKYRINNPENEKWALSALWASRVPLPTKLDNAFLRHYGRILGQYNFGKTYLFSNLGVDFTSISQNREVFLAYTLGIGRNFADGLYAFVETFGFDSLESSFWSKGLNAGVIYIIRKRYQIDAVFGIDLDTSVSQYNFFTLGFSTYFSFNAK